MLEVEGGVGISPTYDKTERGVAVLVSCTTSQSVPPYSILKWRQPRVQVVPVPHVSQNYSWDCGLACVVMVLRASHVQPYAELASLHETCSTKSGLWTVDLAHLLARSGLHVLFATVHLGANPAYASERFYASNMEMDRARVTRLFEEAEEAGITVERRSVPTQELQERLLEGGHLIIALVDRWRLAGVPGATSRVGLEPTASQTRGGHDRFCSYTGHYIVLCGYSEITNSFLIQDPMSRTGTNEEVSHHRLASARLAFGTDEDTLLISLPKMGEYPQYPCLA